MHLAQVVEAVHALGPAAKLAGRLRTAQEQLAEDSGFAAAEIEGRVDTGRLTPIAILAWLGVGIPLAWGVWITLSKSLALFG